MVLFAIDRETFLCFFHFLIHFIVFFLFILIFFEIFSFLRPFSIFVRQFECTELPVTQKILPDGKFHPVVTLI
jgi:hypothetical protein